MAYTIISQNNSTTTLSDGVNTITVPSRVNLTSGNFTIVEVNNNMATLEDGDGNVYRDIPCVATLAGEGGGGGSGLPDQTGHSGEFLTTDGTDASWAAVNALQNTATGSGALTLLGTVANSNNATNIGTYSKATSSSSTAYGAGAEATAQAANALGCWSVANNKSALAVGNTAQAKAIGAIQLSRGTNTTAGTMSVGLTTDGTNFNNYELLSSDGTIPTARLADTTNAQQGDVLTLDSNGDAVWQAGGSGGGLQNTATNISSLTILGDATNSEASINIGWSSAVHDDYSVVFGNSARTSHSQQSVVVGFNAAASDTLGTQQYFNTVYGYAAQTRDASNGVAIGNQAFVNANGAMQFGCGANAEAGTVCFALTTTNDDSNFTNYKLLDSDGTIPTARLTKVNSTITLTAAGWSSNTQTVTVTGMTATGVVLVSPDPTDQSAYTSAGIICTAQAADSLTFTCSTTPTADIDVNVVML